MTDRRANELPPSPKTDDGPDLNLAELVVAFRRRRALFLSCIAGSILLGLLYLGVAKRRFTAEAQLEVLSARSSSNISELAAAGPDTSALELGVTMQTYAGVLSSERLALNVIQELHLEQTPEFHMNAREEEEHLSLGDAPHRREQILKKFERNLAVSAGSGSKLLTISFKATDPNTANRVLGQLVSDFIAYNAGLQYSASERTESWLGTQLGELRTQVQRSEEDAAKAQRDSGFYGTGEEHNLVLARLDSLQQELLNAEQNRIVKGAVLHVVETGDPEAISSLSSTAGQATSPGSVNSLALIQTLRQQEASLSSQLADLSTKFGPAYPRLTELQRQLSDVRSSLSRESDRLMQRAKNDFRAATDQEQSFQQQVDRQKVIANQSNNAAIRYVIANREATSTRELYERLLERSKELGVVAGLQANDVTIVDPAHVSASTTPSIPLTLLVALGAGVLLGFCAVLLRDSLDPMLRSPAMLERLSGLTLMGAIPRVSAGDLGRVRNLARERAPSSPLLSTEEPLYRFVVLAPDTAFTEAFRLLALKFQRSTKLREARLVLVAGALQDEGKGVVAMNLAAVLTQNSCRVLVVDTDLRSAALSRRLGLGAHAGVAELLRSPSPESVVQPVLLGNGLSFLPAGIHSSSSAERPASMEWRALLTTLSAAYDLVLLTAAPILSTSDAATLAGMVDAVLLVARDRVSKKEGWIQALRLLRSVQAPLSGVIYNAVDPSSTDLPAFAPQEVYETQPL